MPEHGWISISSLITVVRMRSDQGLYEGIGGIVGRDFVKDLEQNGKDTVLGWELGLKEKVEPNWYPSVLLF